MGPYLSEPIRKKESECGANDHIRFGVSSMQGWRKAQEDTYLAEINLVNEQGIFGVFDGHVGKEVAFFVKQNFVSEIQKLHSF